MTKFNCDICNAPMELSKILPKGKGRAGKYRRRRFKCTICDYQKLIHADGQKDERYFPEIGIDETKRIADQEADNRNF